MLSIYKYIASHIRGELSLSKTFWLNYVFVNLCLIVTSCFLLFYWLMICKVSIVALSIIMLRYLPWALFFISALYAVQAIGVAMCIKRYIHIKKQYLWPVFAGVFLAADISSQIYMDLNNGSLSEDLRLYASCKNPSTCQDEMGKYHLTISDDKNSLFINGYFVYGVSDNVEQVLQKNPDIKTVSLTSPGGRAYEGARLAQVINTYGLNTYVPKSCSSACSMAFLGGHERKIASTAKLGFHSISFGDDEQGFAYIFAKQIHTQLFKIHNENGIPDTFIQKVVDTSSNNMWYPTMAEMQKTTIITGVV